jgi:hypothetical protein
LGLLLLLLGGVGMSEAHAGKFWVGGGLGLGFGDVQWVDLSAVVGYRISPRWDVGSQLSYRSREDTRFEPDVTTNDYGGSLFGRYVVTPPLFVQVEYEVLSYEFVLPDLSTGRDTYDSLLAGAGIAQPISPNVVFWAAGLYNLTYDSSEIYRPYDSPWVFRAGFGFTF